MLWNSDKEDGILDAIQCDFCILIMALKLLLCKLIVMVGI